MTTHYQSGTSGAVLISAMPHRYAKSALAKLQRDDPSRVAEIAALADHIVTLDEAFEAANGLPRDHQPGANLPPAEPDPEPRLGPQSFPAIAAHLDSLLTEARNWADGKPLENQAQADTLARLIDQLREGEKLADKARKTEREPHDVAIDEIQGRYGAYIAPATNKGVKGSVSLALVALKQTQTVWLLAVEAAQKAEAARLAAEAAAKLQAAQDALRASAGNIEAREEAEELFTEAKVTERQAVAAGNTKAQAHGDGRATALRDNWETTLTDGVSALRWAWAKYRPQLEALALELARAEVRSGARTIAGFEIKNERRV